MADNDIKRIKVYEESCTDIKLYQQIKKKNAEVIKLEKELKILKSNLIESIEQVKQLCIPSSFSFDINTCKKPTIEEALLHNNIIDSNHVLDTIENFHSAHKEFNQKIEQAEKLLFTEDSSSWFDIMISFLFRVFLPSNYIFFNQSENSISLDDKKYLTKIVEDYKFDLQDLLAGEKLECSSFSDDKTTCSSSQDQTCNLDLATAKKNILDNCAIIFPMETYNDGLIIQNAGEVNISNSTM